MVEDYRERLYTIDEQGRRMWVYPRVIRGAFYRPRAVVAYVLMALYLLLPWITVGGHQGVHFDLPHRKFIFFGEVFWATDSYFLFLIFGLLAFSLFFFTAVLGRVWCGWACPETVFLEFLFRPIEQLIEGGPVKRLKLNQSAWTFEKIWKKALKAFIFAALCWLIASTTLAYFVGRETLFEMILGSPFQHPTPFVLTVVLMALLAFQFGWFREQFCTALCPYARFQSALMDSNSLTVGYDTVRGEPRGGMKAGKIIDGNGDCIDCGLCIGVCPTGIDIRNGLQLECIACTACIDACDSVMKKIGKPKGLIRYDTEDRLLGRTKDWNFFRPRPIVYAGILIIYSIVLVYLLATREMSEFQIVRGALDKPYSTLMDGRISNHLHVRVSNKSEVPELYRFDAKGIEGVELITPLVPLNVKADSMLTTPLFINFPRAALINGKRQIEVSIQSESGFESSQQITLLGPDD